MIGCTTGDLPAIRGGLPGCFFIIITGPGKVPRACRAPLDIMLGGSPVVQASREKCVSIPGSCTIGPCVSR